MKLSIGDPAPLFEAVDQAGQTIRLADLKGKKVVVFFYPKNHTPGCTKQVQNLRDAYAALTDAGYKLLGVSSDGQASHQRFSHKYQLPFSLLSDTNQLIRKSYQAFKADGEKPARKTFLIDSSGRIAKIIDAVKTSAHAEQILHA